MADLELRWDHAELAEEASYVVEMQEATSCGVEHIAMSIPDRHPVEELARSVERFWGGLVDHYLAPRLPELLAMTLALLVVMLIAGGVTLDTEQTRLRGDVLEGRIALHEMDADRREAVLWRDELVRRESLGASVVQP